MIAPPLPKQVDALEGSEMAPARPLLVLEPSMGRIYDAQPKFSHPQTEVDIVESDGEYLIKPAYGIGQPRRAASAVQSSICRVTPSKLASRSCELRAYMAAVRGIACLH